MATIIPKSKISFGSVWLTWLWGPSEQWSADKDLPIFEPSSRDRLHARMFPLRVKFYGCRTRALVKARLCSTANRKHPARFLQGKRLDRRKRRPCSDGSCRHAGAKPQLASRNGQSPGRGISRASAADAPGRRAPGALVPDAVPPLGAGWVDVPPSPDAAPAPREEVARPSGVVLARMAALRQSDAARVPPWGAGPELPDAPLRRPDGSPRGAARARLGASRPRSPRGARPPADAAPLVPHA